MPNDGSSGFFLVPKSLSAEQYRVLLVSGPVSLSTIPSTGRTLVSLARQAGRRRGWPANGLLCYGPDV